MAKRRRFSRARRYFGRKRRHGVKDKRFPLLVGIPVVHQALIQPGMAAWERAQAGDAPGAALTFANNLANNFAFCDISEGHPIFNQNAINRSIGTYAMILGGFAGSKIASAVGANRVMKRVPFVGKYVKL